MMAKSEGSTQLKGKSRSCLVGITGGSGSGKTTFARELIQKLSPSSALLIQQDRYYRDLKNLSQKDRSGQNFDEPDAIENDLLVNHLILLKNGEAVRVPVYDFRTHLRTGWESILPAPIIVVEGILLLCHEPLARLLDFKIFVDTDSDIRFIRRLKRDMVSRGRSADSIIEQYLGSVRPSFQKWVEPTRETADLVISGNGPFSPSVASVAEILKLHHRGTEN